MDRMDVLMALLGYVDHGRWGTQRALQVSMYFRTCHPKLMSFLICWKGSTFLPKASQGSQWHAVLIVY